MNLLTKLVATAKGVLSHPLRKGPPLPALWHYGICQLAARFSPGDVIVSFPNETRLVVPPRMKGAAHFIAPGLCEFAEMSFVVHYLRAGDWFVDVGANIGAYTLLASGVAGACTIACEPSPSTFTSLRQTLRINNLEDKATALNCAVGARTGHLFLTEGLGTENHLVAEAGNGAIQVPVKTLDELLADQRPALLKIDVEGFEADVLEGAQGLLAANLIPALIIERAGNAERFGRTEDRLHYDLQKRGLLPYAYDPYSRSLRRLPDDAHGNLIYLRDPEAVTARLKAAPPYRFDGFRV